MNTETVVEQHSHKQGVDRVVQEIIDQKRSLAHDLLPHSAVFSVNIFNSPKDLEKEMIKSGLFDENYAHYLYVTTVPEGHPDHMSVAKAGKHFFPGMAEYAINSYLRKAEVELRRTMYFTPGDILNYSRNVETVKESKVRRAKKEVSETVQKTPRKYEKVPVSDKAQVLAHREALGRFRKEQGLPAKGKIDGKLEEAKNKYLKDNLQGIYDKILESLKNAPQKKRGRKPGSKNVVHVQA